MTWNTIVGVVALGAACVGVSCASPAEETARPAAASSSAPAAPAVTPAMLERGRALYQAKCAACHGEGGRGDGPGAGVMKPPPRDHTDRAYMSTLTDEDLARVIQMGGAVRGKPLMPSNPDLRGDDLAAIVAFTRSLSSPGSGTP